MKLYSRKIDVQSSLIKNTQTHMIEQFSSRIADSVGNKQRWISTDKRVFFIYKQYRRTRSVSVSHFVIGRPLFENRAIIAIFVVRIVFCVRFAICRIVMTMTWHQFGPIVWQSCEMVDWKFSRRHLSAAALTSGENLVRVLAKFFRCLFAICTMSRS